MSTAGLDAILDDLLCGLERRAAARRSRARAAVGSTMAAALVALALAGGGGAINGPSSLAVSSGVGSSDASVLLRGCTSNTGLACNQPLAPKSS